MSNYTPQNTAQALESKAVAAERSISTQPDNDSALQAAISGVELYMQALKLADNATERSRLEAKTKELLAKAESIKAIKHGKPPMAKAYPGDMKQPKSTRKLTTREEIIKLEGSKLNGAVFRPWTQAPTNADFELKKDEELFLDLPHLPLSTAQEQSFAGWRRPQEALPMIVIKKDGITLSNDPTMVQAGKIDLVQDMTSDCSVVASLCAGTARAERGHPRILGSILYPYDYTNDQIILSPNGKYVLRLYFNGDWRRVEIDDLLPTSKNSRVLHVTDRAHPGLLWPALVEKAYLKVRGGYDFPGSNSGTDLAVLTGWIPQQVFLHDEDVDHNELWDELYRAFKKGDVLLTIGTGKLSRREQRELGLGAEHDYAILELKATAEVKEVLIKNPWSDGDVWTGASRRRPNPSHEPGSDGQHVSENLEMMPGTFWMDFNSIFHYFENMYINWNPGTFTDRQDFHFTWNAQDLLLAPNVFVDNPQFSVRVSAAGEVWLLLNRHFRTGDYTHANTGKNGYISLYLFDKDGMKVLSSEGAMIRGPFVDSPNTLIRFTAKANVAYTAVVVSQDLQGGKHNFTLSALANAAITLDHPQSKYQNQTSLAAAWTFDTAGGNSDSMQYLNNPQFGFTVTSDDTKAALVLRVMPDARLDSKEANIHVKLLVSFGLPNRRITRLRPRDTLANSGDYRHGSTVVETTLAKGTYVVICSTFQENQRARFQLDLFTSSPTPSSQVPVLNLLPTESAGRFSTMSAPVALPDGVSQVAASLTIPYTSKAIFIARPGRRQREQIDSSQLYKISLQQGQGPYAKVLASSAEGLNEFFSATSGLLRIEDQHLNPRLSAVEMGGLWVVLERPVGQASSSNGSSGASQVLEVEILAEEKYQIGEWKMVQG